MKKHLKGSHCFYFLISLVMTNQFNWIINIFMHGIKKEKHYNI